mgnify:FL=1
MSQKINILNKKKILLLGDFFLDEFLFGSCERLSPEAPVPIIKYDYTENNLGGAGNVLSNLHNLGIEVLPVGILGTDNVSKKILNFLKNIKINTKNFIIDKNCNGILKKRLVVQNQHIARIDYENLNFSLAKKYENRIVNNVKKLIIKTDLIVISDYGKGSLNEHIIQSVINMANDLDIETIVDPRKMHNDYSIYKNSSFITPNLNELRNIFPSIKNTNKDIDRSAVKLKKNYKFKNILVTRGEMGISLINDKTKKNFRSTAKQVFDVSGAGDTVVSALAGCLLLKMSINKSIKIANLCAGHVISLRGTKPITFEKFKEFLK